VDAGRKPLKFSLHLNRFWGSQDPRRKFFAERTYRIQNKTGEVKPSPVFYCLKLKNQFTPPLLCLTAVFLVSEYSLSVPVKKRL